MSDGFLDFWMTGIETRLKALEHEKEHAYDGIEKLFSKIDKLEKEICPICKENGIFLKKE